MNRWQNPLLILRRVDWISDSDSPGTADPWDSPEPTSGFYRFDSDGDLTGFSKARAAALKPTSIPELSPSEVLYSFDVDPRKPEWALVSLPDADLSELTRFKSERLTSFRDELVGQVFSVGEDAHWFADQFHTITYLEATQPLLPPNPSPTDLASLVLSIRAEFGQSHYGAIPQHFQDLLVFPGPLGPRFIRDLLVLRLQPRNPKGKHYEVPRSAILLSRILAIEPRLGREREQIDSHPMLQAAPQEYFHHLAKELETRLRRLDQKRDRHLASAYKDHLQERLRSIVSQKTVRLLSAQWKEATNILETNSREHSDDWLWHTEVISNNPYRYGLMWKLLSDMKKAGDAIDRSVDELDATDRALSEYLRDYLNIEVARTNLELQRTAYRLGVLAVLIALLALVLTG